MRSLFLKIFAIFWLAQSLIFVISTTLIVRQRFPSPNIVGDALDTNLTHDAAVAVSAYETGGCAGFNNSNRFEPAGALLLDQRGQTVCRTSNAQPFSEAVPLSSRRVDGRQIDGRYVWLVPVRSSTGVNYQYAWLQEPPSSQRPLRHSPLLRFAFPQMPVAIAVGGLTTFALVLLFTRPLVRLRKAARELAQGNLSTRVEENGSGKGLLAQSDEFQGLVHDFNHMAGRLESLVGAQRLLLRDVSHELRSPLSRLSVALELAREDAGTELEEHLHRIEREADKLNKLIGQLLTLSSMETNERTSRFAPVSLNEICRQIVPDAKYEAQQRPCTIALEEEAECVISGDRELLYRAIENVIRNAIRYTDAETNVTVRIAEMMIGAEKFALVEVTDEGPGIPEAELPYIFRPFYRVDPARSSSTGGFGVGLAIAERAVTLHGGTLRAANRKERGTSIELMVPIV